MNNNKTDRAFWNNTYWCAEDHKVKAEPLTVFRLHPIRTWIEAHATTATKGQSCIEVGCYPGRFLTIFGDLGYTLSGIDFAENIDEVPRNLKEQGYNVDRFWNGDFFEMSIDQTFDIVSSFGFIEHFTDVERTLEAHMRLVADHGLLIIEVPNFVGPVQRIIHRVFDKANYGMHHLPAMDMKKLARILEHSGFDILAQGYFGAFQFWVEPGRRGVMSRMCLKRMEQASRVLRRILPPHKRLYSPYGGVIARKTSVNGSRPSPVRTHRWPSDARSNDPGVAP